MKSFPQHLKSQVSIQPTIHLVDLFAESTAYDRYWRLPFNALSLCVDDSPEDPSWVELPETGERFSYQKGQVYFTTCDTPMRIRYTEKNHHYCIHFRYELFPGVDLFSGLHKRFTLEKKEFSGKIKKVFQEKDPLKRITRAEGVILEAVLEFWPEKLPLDLNRMEQFSKLMEFIDTHLDSKLNAGKLAAVMGWSEAYFSRTFHATFHITPKQYLLREVFTKALGLLNDPQKNIKEVAEELKFSSEFNFSRFIRHYSGFTPSALRRKNQGPLYIKK